MLSILLVKKRMLIQVNFQAETQVKVFLLNWVPECEETAATEVGVVVVAAAAAAAAKVFCCQYGGGLASRLAGLASPRYSEM